MRYRRPGSPVLLGFLASLGLAGDGLAAPVSHTVLGGPSVITGNYSASMTLAIHTNLGTASTPVVNLSGSFTDNAAKPVGDATVDWGSPAWDDAAEALAGHDGKLVINR